MVDRYIPISEVHPANLDKLKKELELDEHAIWAKTHKALVVTKITERLKKIEKKELELDEQAALYEHRIHILIRNEFYLINKYKKESNDNKRKEWKEMFEREQAATDSAIDVLIHLLVKRLKISNGEKKDIKEELKFVKDLRKDEVKL